MTEDVRLAHHQLVVVLAALLHRGPVTDSGVAQSVEKAERFLAYAHAALEAARPDPLRDGLARPTPFPRPLGR